MTILERGKLALKRLEFKAWKRQMESHIDMVRTNAAITGWHDTADRLIANAEAEIARREAELHG